MSLMRTAGRAIAITSLVLGSTVAQAAAPAGPAREGSAVNDSEAVAGAGFGWVIAALVAVGMILVISDDNNDNNYPTSP